MEASHSLRGDSARRDTAVEVRAVHVASTNSKQRRRRLDRHDSEQKYLSYEKPAVAVAVTTDG